jgi:glycogen debranching enzyme
VNALIDGVTYLVSDGPSDAAGLYHGDTRHLLPVSVDVDGVDLTLLDETRRPPSRRTRRYANVGTAINTISETATTKHSTVVLARRQTVNEGRLVERVELRNHDASERTFDVTLRFDADFADIFEVRGLREASARTVAADAGDREATYEYTYTDDAGDPVTLETAVAFDDPPATLEPDAATYSVALGPQEEWRAAVEVTPRRNESTVRAPPVEDAADAAGERRVNPFVTGPVETGNPEYDSTFAQARRDVCALTTRTEHGPVPLAGAPWFVTVFGRDALLASYLLLPFAPALAEGTLRYLAAHQGSLHDDSRDEVPGKILHEMRRGELARTELIPQVPYYGSVDATPLWVVLLHETWRWTGDDDLVSTLWGPLERALDWLEREVEAVGSDPFLYYRDLGNGGVVHKVWRDSANGVQFADGRQASPPLASAAVQGYLYDALTRAAALAAASDDGALAAALESRADDLAAAFDDAFWMPDRECYAAALTADGRQVDSVTSSVGHCLWSGVVPSRRASAVGDRLLDPDLFSGWGLRTLSERDDGYSPVSYHAGGVWPHDNALAALGLARYGLREAASTVADRQLAAFAELDDHSVPELFCGFDDSTPPAVYPSSCRPQAWAAAAPYGFARAVFDLEPGGLDDEPAGRASDAIAPDGRPAADGALDAMRTLEYLRAGRDGFPRTPLDMVDRVPARRRGGRD